MLRQALGPDQMESERAILTTGKNVDLMRELYVTSYQPPLNKNTHYLNFTIQCLSVLKFGVSVYSNYIFIQKLSSCIFID